MTAIARRMKHRVFRTGRDSWTWASRRVSAAMGRSPVLRRFRFLSIPGAFALVEQKEVFVVSTRDKFIGKSVYLSGSFDFEKFEKAFALAGLEMGDVRLVDVGANIGTITIPALRRGFVRDAVCLEPDPFNLRLLRANIQLNDLGSRTTVYPFAAGARRERLHLMQSADNLGDHRVVAESAAGPLPAELSIRVEVHPLDDLDRLNEDGTWLLWIDVQGFEAQVLRGASDLVSRCAGVVVEYDPGMLASAGNQDAFVETVTALPQTMMLDLSEDTPRPVRVTRAALETCAARLPTGGYTDLLFIRDPANLGTQPRRRRDFGAAGRTGHLAGRHQ